MHELEENVMPGITTIVKKEISDAVTNKSFLLSFAILVLCMALSGFSAANTYNSQRSAMTRDRLIILSNIAPIINLLGALVAIALGFASINKERPEGSLKVVLTYPIYRDQVILGKLLGNLAILTVATTAASGISLSLYLAMTKIVLNSEMIVRFGTLTILAILLLSTYLGISLLLSVYISDPKTTLLYTFLILGVFNSEIFHSAGEIISSLFYSKVSRAWGLGGSVPTFTSARNLQNFIASLSPAFDFSTFATNLGNYLQPVNVNNVVVNQRFTDLIANNLVYLPVLIALPIATFVGCYILFTRMDVS
jgi:ABC-2 type transport system permease protein